MQYQVNVIRYLLLGQDKTQPIRHKSTVHAGSLTQAQQIAQALAIKEFNNHRLGTARVQSWQTAEVCVRIPVYTEELHSLILPITCLKELDESISDVLYQIGQDERDASNHKASVSALVAEPARLKDVMAKPAHHDEDDND